MGSTVVADEAPSWNGWEARFEVHHIDHGQAYSLDGIYSNGAESYFSRLRRAEIGHHHHIAGPFLVRYAEESAWREDHRRVDNGTQVNAVTTPAMDAPVSVAGAGIGSGRLKRGTKHHY